MVHFPIFSCSIRMNEVMNLNGKKTPIPNDTISEVNSCMDFSSSSCLTSIVTNGSDAIVQIELCTETREEMLHFMDAQ